MNDMKNELAALRAEAMEINQIVSKCLEPKELAELAARDRRHNEKFYDFLGRVLELVK